MAIVARETPEGRVRVWVLLPEDHASEREAKPSPAEVHGAAVDAATARAQGEPQPQLLALMPGAFIFMTYWYS